MGVRVSPSRLMLVKLIVVFLSVMFAEIFWTRWTLGVQQKNKLKAANATFMIILLGGITFISYTTSHWLLLPAAFGGWAGTYLMMAHDERGSV